MNVRYADILQKQLHQNGVLTVAVTELSLNESKAKCHKEKPSSLQDTIFHNNFGG